MNDNPSRIAVLTTRDAGYDLALRLAGAGYSVMFFDPDLEADREQVLVEIGIGVADDVSTSVAGVDVVVTMLDGPDDVEDLYMETGGLIESVPAGTFLVDATTSSPRLARELYAIGAVNDLHVLDAPLVYPVFGDAETVPLVTVGGDESDVAAMRDVLRGMGETVMHLGGPGKGQLGKLTELIATASSIMAVVEAVVFARESGIEPSRAIDLLKVQGTHSSAALRAAQRALEGSYRYAISAESFADDLGIALSVADALDLTLPGLESAFQLYDLLTVIDGGSYGPQALMLLYADEETCHAAGLDWTKADDEDLYFGDDYDGPDSDDTDDLDYPSTYPGGRQVPQHRRRGTDENGGMLESFFSPN